MSKIFKTKSGWVKRLPDCNLGPFETKEEAEKAYKPAPTKKVEKKVFEKKIEKVENKEEKKEF
jgi:hypothetical protein